MRKQRIVPMINANRLIPMWQKGLFIAVGLASNIFFFVPLIIYFQYKNFLVRKGLKEIEKKAKIELRKFIGREPDYMDVSFSATMRNGERLASASALAVAKGKVFLVDEGIACELDYDEIRNWKWEIEGYTTYRGTGSDSLSAALWTRESRANALVNSGFFVRIADVEKPEWHFVSDDKTLLMKWGEIFTRLDEQHTNQLANREKQPERSI